MNSRFLSTNNLFTSFLNFVVHYPEWRLMYIYPNNINFFICKWGGVKGGFFPQHAWSTVILADKIGHNFQVGQNVTVGRMHSGGGIPTIGDNVKICAGACVLGNIYIGNNVTIGANAVVLTDVPDNCIAVGVPAVFKRRQCS